MKVGGLIGTHNSTSIVKSANEQFTICYGLTGQYTDEGPTYRIADIPPVYIY